MHARSLVLTLVATGLFGFALLRCSLPPLSSGPVAFATRERFLRGAVVKTAASPGGHADLASAMKEVELKTLILAADAKDNVDDRVAQAVSLQRELDADVFVGGQARMSFDALLDATALAVDAEFTTCGPRGPTVPDARAATIEKVRFCARAASQELSAKLDVAKTNKRIGCFLTVEPELRAQVSAPLSAALNALLVDAARPCRDAGRPVAVAVRVPPSAGDPDVVATEFRESLRNTGMSLVLVRDGVGTFDAGAPRRALAYYVALRNELADRQAPFGPVSIWADVEAFECTETTCKARRPASFARFTEQLCAARSRVDGIVTTEYIDDLAEEPLVDGGALDASRSDRDAAAGLRAAYASWRDSGAACPK